MSNIKLNNSKKIITTMLLSSTILGSASNASANTFGINTAFSYLSSIKETVSSLFSNESSGYELDNDSDIDSEGSYFVREDDDPKTYEDGINNHGIDEDENDATDRLGLNNKTSSDLINEYGINEHGVDEDGNDATDRLGLNEDSDEESEDTTRNSNKNTTKAISTNSKPKKQEAKIVNPSTQKSQQESKNNAEVDANDEDTQDNTQPETASLESNTNKLGIKDSFEEVGNIEEAAGEALDSRIKELGGARRRSLASNSGGNTGLAAGSNSSSEVAGVWGKVFGRMANKASSEQDSKSRSSKLAGAMVGADYRLADNQVIGAGVQITGGSVTSGLEEESQDTASLLGLGGLAYGRLDIGDHFFTNLNLRASRNSITYNSEASSSEDSSGQDSRENNDSDNSGEVIWNIRPELNVGVDYSYGKYEFTGLVGLYEQSRLGSNDSSHKLGGKVELEQGLNFISNEVSIKPYLAEGADFAFYESNHSGSEEKAGASANDTGAAISPISEDRVIGKIGPGIRVEGDNFSLEASYSYSRGLNSIHSGHSAAIKATMKL